MHLVSDTKQRIIPFGYSSLARYRNLPSPPVVVRPLPGRFSLPATYKTDLKSKAIPRKHDFCLGSEIENRQTELKCFEIATKTVPDPISEDMFLNKLRRAEIMSRGFSNGVALGKPILSDSCYAPCHNAAPKSFDYRTFAALPTCALLRDVGSRRYPVRLVMSALPCF